MLRICLSVFTGLLLCGCTSLPWCKKSYEFAGIPQEMYLSRQTGNADMTRIPADAVKFTMGKKFIELDDIDKVQRKALSKSIVYTTFTLKKAREISFIVGADWYVNVFLNGKAVFSSANRSKGIYSTFGVRAMAEKGKNIIAIEVIRGKASSNFFFAEGVKTELPDDVPVLITADPAEISGKIKPMNAVNNAPRSGGSTQTKSNMTSWQKARIPYSRTHDASISGYGSAHIVDVHMIFPDFSKDPYDPRSYDFILTDNYLKEVIKGGSRIFYRLGSRIEHSIVKYGTRKPADFRKWAVICEHIIRHYTSGWANGYNWDIQYWEIWNEADLSSGKENKKTWGGSDEEFFSFYRIAALHLKKQFPHLKIGGPALAGNIGWMKKFLAAMTEGERVPLDFFSWHIYTNDPENIINKSKAIRNILNSYGYNKTESILNEWNYLRNWTDKFVYTIKSIISIKGAAFAAATMSRCQDSDIDMLMYYDARPGTGFNGLFDFYTFEPLKSYYVFSMWSDLAELGKQFKVSINSVAGIAATGAADGKGKVALMVSRYFEKDELPKAVPVTIALKNISGRSLKVYMLEELINMKEIPVKYNRDGSITFTMKPHSVVLIRN